MKVLLEMGLSTLTLGIFSVGDSPNSGVLAERTEARSNIVEWKNEIPEELKSRVRETAWVVRANNIEAAAVMAVCIICFSDLCHSPL